ncbi:hypothetical protein DF048_27830 [Burkholderia seminalis]|nr:hypothetical protein DF048_27830 [Burkholderia seminalis]
MINLDRMDFDVPCPRCRFENDIFGRQVRLRDVIICRGCKTNIRLDDHMNEYRKARQQIDQTFAELEHVFASFNKTIRL